MSAKVRPGTILLLLIGACAAQAADPGPVVEAEAIFLDFLDADSAVGVIDSGFVTQYQGRDRAAWETQLRDRHAALTAQLASAAQQTLSPDDAAAVAAMRVTLADHGDPSAAVANAPDAPT